MTNFVCKPLSPLTPLTRFPNVSLWTARALSWTNFVCRWFSQFWRVTELGTNPKNSWGHDKGNSCAAGCGLDNHRTVHNVCHLVSIRTPHTPIYIAFLVHLQHLIPCSNKSPKQAESSKSGQTLSILSNQNTQWAPQPRVWCTDDWRPIKPLLKLFQISLLRPAP